MFSKLKYLVVVALIAFTYSCVKKKTYSQDPEITYKAFTLDTGTTANMTITFADGDGDIGKENSDTTRNLFMNYYYKDTITQQFVAFWNGTDSLKSGYTVHKPNDEYNGKPISGEVTLHMGFYRHSKKIKTIRYVIYMYDNSGHKSNVVTTPDLVVP